MGTKDPRVDAYIEKSADFARPILSRLRKLVHQGCPQVEETIKWGAPFFMYRGVLCMMAAFKALSKEKEFGAVARRFCATPGTLRELASLLRSRQRGPSESI